MKPIRNIEVKQKESGQFHSPEGAARFAILRPVTDSIVNNNRIVPSTLDFFANFKTD